MPALGHVYWRGFLRLQLVSINVDIYGATETGAEIHFNQIHKPSGKRVKYEKVVPGIGPIESSDIVKGYQVEPDVYVTMEPEEIEAIKLESKKTIDMVQFVDAGQIDARYYERPYYIVPKDEVAAEGYLVIREALEKAGKVGLGQLTMQGREHLGVIAPTEKKGLLLNIIRYEDELRKADKYFADLEAVKFDPELVNLASELIERNSGPFNPKRFKDTYAEELRKLVEKKAKGQKIEISKSEKPQPSNVVNLMDALKKSLKGEEKQPKTARKRKSARS
ncbi:MAG TPA: Ku protein [Aestuariivirgaceae bacterium]|nr:Ku protein [Aestuariivirgaceae bacterium]